MGMFAKHDTSILKISLEVQFSDNYNRWYIPNLSIGRTNIKNISDVKTSWDRTQKGIEHYRNLCAFCNNIGEWANQ